MQQYTLFNKDPIELPILYKSVVELIQEAPDAPAVMQGATVYSYQQLYAIAQDIRDKLHGSGIKPGQRVAIAMPRSPRLLMIILGCILARVSFMSVPAEVSQPQTLTFADNNCCAGLISDTSDTPETGDALLAGALLHLVPAQKNSSTISALSGGEIYCVRTSGSTGQPKTVPIHARQVNAYLHNITTALAMPRYQKWLWLHHISFDFSMWEIFGCLTHRGCLVVPDDTRQRNPETIRQFLHDAGIHVFSTTPSEFRHIFSGCRDMDFLQGLSLTNIVFCGEKLTVNTLKPFFDLFEKQGIQLLNTYGPSEATIFCSTHKVTARDISAGDIPIGQPLPGIGFELVDIDDKGQGNLCLTGDQIFDGYAGEPLLGERYLTGDICYRNVAGDYCFVGRNEGYQKLNGFRISPLAIETFLLAQPFVHNAFVWVEKTGDEIGYIAACLHISKDAVVSSRDLRLICARNLPEHQRPSQYLLLSDSEWPTNERGKTDRALLRSMLHGNS